MNLEWQGDIARVTPLRESISNLRSNNVQLLIKAGANINDEAPANEGLGTPAIAAAQIGWLEGVCIFLEAGADIRPKTIAGDDLTYLVVERDVDPATDQVQWKEKALRLLRERGADIDAATAKWRVEQEKEKKKRPLEPH